MRAFLGFGAFIFIINLVFVFIDWFVDTIGDAAPFVFIALVTGTIYTIRKLLKGNKN